MIPYSPVDFDFLPASNKLAIFFGRVTSERRGGVRECHEWVSLAVWEVVGGPPVFHLPDWLDLNPSCTGWTDWPLRYFGLRVAGLDEERALALGLGELLFGLGSALAVNETYSVVDHTLQLWNWTTGEPVTGRYRPVQIPSFRSELALVNDLAVTIRDVGLRAAETALPALPDLLRSNPPSTSPTGSL